jgi:nucleoside-diphosphate-sugar epimerase
VAPLVQHVPRAAIARFKSVANGVAPHVESAAPKLPPLGLLRIYASRTVFANDKAKRVLGYGPQVGFEQAMAVTHQWAQWARLTP